MTLHPDERKTLVKYRLDKAFEALEQVKGVSELGYWTLAANRLYYSAYYACVALLINNGIETTTHKGALRMISYKFVKEGLLPQEDSQLLGRLFTMRHTGDYDDLFDWEKKDVMPLIPEVEGFVNRIKSLIQKEDSDIQTQD